MLCCPAVLCKHTMPWGLLQGRLRGSRWVAQRHVCLQACLPVHAASDEICTTISVLVHPPFLQGLPYHMAAAAAAAGVLSRAAQLEPSAAPAGLRRLPLRTARSSRGMGAGRRFGTSWRATPHCAALQWIQTSLGAAVPSPTMQPLMRCWTCAGAARGCSCAACRAMPARKRFGMSCSSAKRFQRGCSPRDGGQTPPPDSRPCQLLRRAPCALH